MRFGLRELIFLVVLLAVPVASFIFVFKPRNDEIRLARREIEIKQDKLAQVDEVSARIENIGNAIDDWRDAVSNIENKLPSAQGVDEILEQVWTLTSKNGLTIVSTETDNAVPSAGYMELPLKIEMAGNFDAFYQFLLELEQLDRITRIHNIHVMRAGAGKGARNRRNAPKAEDLPDGWMEAKFTLSIFYELDAAQRSVAAAQ